MLKPNSKVSIIKKEMLLYKNTEYTLKIFMVNS